MFQLIATGNYVYHNGTGRIHSKKIFRDAAIAKAYIPKFKEMCTTPIDDNDLFVLENVTSIKLVELEIEG